MAEGAGKEEKQIAMCWSLIILFVALPCWAQMGKQRACADQVHADMAKTKNQSPKVFATIKSYAFEYSKSYDACVIVIQYIVQQRDKPDMVQILAMNAVTMQPMLRNTEVYLIPASAGAQIDAAADTLFEKYSH